MHSTSVRVLYIQLLHASYPDIFDSFGEIPTILSGDHHTSESELRGFEDAFLEEVYIFHHTCKRYFSEIDRISERFP